MRTSRSLMVPAVAAGLLALTSCSADADPDAATDTMAPDATPSPTQAEPTEAEPTESEASGTGDAACLEGEWEGALRAAEQRTLGSLDLGELQVDPEVETSGEAWVSFDGSMMTSEFEDQTTTVTFEPSEGEEVVASTTLDGSTTGSYEVEGDQLMISEVDVSDLTTENTAELGGEEYDLPGLEDLQAESFAIDSAFTFECSDDELRLTPVLDEVPLDENDEVPDEDEAEDALTQVLTRR